MLDNIQFQVPGKEVLGKFPGDSPFLKTVLLPAGVIILVILAGVGTGWFLSSGKGAGIGRGGLAVAPGAQVGQGGKEVGIEDVKTFSDSAQGILEKGGLNGEGTHHLVREGGPSQTAYLTSSVVDLDQFVGKKVEVWGQTFEGQKAGWLMDVGRVKILE